MLPLIKRDVRLRLHHGKNLIIAQFSFFLITTVSFILMFTLNDLNTQMEWLSFEQFWDGFSELDLKMFKQDGTLATPYFWLIFQLLYFLSLRTFFTADLTSSGGLIIIRTGTRKFVMSKVISLLLYTTIYIALFVFYICFVSSIQHFLFDSSMSWKANWETSIIFCIFLILVLFLESLFYELASLMMGDIIPYIILISVNFLSIFSQNIVLVTNYTMFSRWSETGLYSDNTLLMLTWVSSMIILLVLLTLWLVKKIDFVYEKGE
ncbi:hypothetical protein [Lentibacillus kimchii]|uniref:ABC-2 family transporter protein n=1 Tax=Lentibacillus kimchii TaxID=1542911 RepID=A0ABW2V0M8_9BACI